MIEWSLSAVPLAAVASEAVAEGRALEWTALAIALYGAVVATFVATKGFLADRVSVFVSHGWSYAMHALARSGRSEPDELHLTAVNDGRRDIVVSSLTLEMSGFGRITPEFVDALTGGGRVAVPRDETETKGKHRRLAPGDTMEERFDTEALKRFLEQTERRRGVVTGRVRAVLEDTTEKFYCSSWFELREGLRWPQLGHEEGGTQSSNLPRE